MTHKSRVMNWSFEYVKPPPKKNRGIRRHLLHLNLQFQNSPERQVQSCPVQWRTRVVSWTEASNPSNPYAKSVVFGGCSKRNPKHARQRVLTVGQTGQRTCRFRLLEAWKAFISISFITRNNSAIFHLYDPGIESQLSCYYTQLFSDACHEINGFIILESPITRNIATSDSNNALNCLN